MIQHEFDKSRKLCELALIKDSMNYDFKLVCFLIDVIGGKVVNHKEYLEFICANDHYSTREFYQDHIGEQLHCFLDSYFIQQKQSELQINYVPICKMIAFIDELHYGTTYLSFELEQEFRERVFNELVGSAPEDIDDDELEDKFPDVIDEKRWVFFTDEDNEEQLSKLIINDTQLFLQRVNLDSKFVVNPHVFIMYPKLQKDIDAYKTCYYKYSQYLNKMDERLRDESYVSDYDPTDDIDPYFDGGGGNEWSDPTQWM